MLFEEKIPNSVAINEAIELTKKFEQTVRGTIAEVLEHFREHEPKGEFVIVVAGCPKPEKEAKRNRYRKEDDEE